MGRPPKARRIILLLISASAITLSTCRGVGVFAFIAVSDPIDESRLPKGTSASRVVQIENEFAASKYAYFSSGSSLFRKNMADRASRSAVWSTVPLPSGWTNIQSMAASNHRLLLALARESGGILTSGLFYYSNTEGFRRVPGTPFTGTRKSYDTLRVFAPNPSGPFYVNVLKHTGAFGMKEARFTGSEIYTLPGAPSAGGGGGLKPAPGTAWRETLKNRYVSSAASSKRETGAGTPPGTTLFSTVNPGNTAGGGALAGSDGVIVDTKIKRAIGGLTWLPNVTAGTGKGAFIMSTLEPSGGSYTVYIGKADSWTAKNSSFRFESFLDISAAKGGGKAPGSTRLVLAGTRSAGITRGSGYMEIDVNSPNPAKWTIRTGRSGFTFADTTNYESGALVQSSIPGLALFDGYVYASTSRNGIWSINANDYKGPSDRPKWAPE